MGSVFKCCKINLYDKSVNSFNKQGIKSDITSSFKGEQRIEKGIPECFPQVLGAKAQKNGLPFFCIIQKWGYK